MTEDLEAKLRRALEPVDPGEDFTRRVLSNLSNTPAPRARARRAGWISAAIAASLLVAAAGVYEWQQSQRAAGLAARAQVIEALRVTSDKLGLASRLLNAPPEPAHSGEPGA